MKEPESKSIVLIGAGNVATQLGLALQEAGYKISQVYSRTQGKVKKLATQLKANAITDLKSLDPDASIYIIAVSDDALAGIVKKLRLGDRLVVHTSGSADIALLKNVSKNYGVLYPLQSISAKKPLAFQSVPLCIEANNKKTAGSLLFFARSISRSVQPVSSKQRAIIHMAAVFANNFSNHLFHISSRILEENKLPARLLAPLISETFDKLKYGTAMEMQTGPAIRGDKKTIKKHLSMLESNKDYREIYQLLSKSIAKQNKKNKQ